MTYNFDPDRWFENELDSVKLKRKTGKISEEEFQKAHEKLMDEYEQMLIRLEIRHEY